MLSIEYVLDTSLLDKSDHSFPQRQKVPLICRALPLPVSPCFKQRSEQHQMPPAPCSSPSLHVHSPLTELSMWAWVHMETLVSAGVTGEPSCTPTHWPRRRGLGVNCHHLLATASFPLVTATHTGLALMQWGRVCCCAATRAGICRGRCVGRCVGRQAPRDRRPTRALDSPALTEPGGPKSAEARRGSGEAPGGAEAGRVKCF